MSVQVYCHSHSFQESEDVFAVFKMFKCLWVCLAISYFYSYLSLLFFNVLLFIQHCGQHCIMLCFINKLELEPSRLYRDVRAIVRTRTNPLQRLWEEICTPLENMTHN